MGIGHYQPMAKVCMKFIDSTFVLDYFDRRHKIFDIFHYFRVSSANPMNYHLRLAKSSKGVKGVKLHGKNFHDNFDSRG